MDENIQINYIYMMQVASVLSIEHNFEEQLEWSDEYRIYAG